MRGQDFLIEGGEDQRMAIFIAIYRYIDISRVFRHIVVYLLYIEGKSGHFNNVVVLMKA